MSTGRRSPLDVAAQKGREAALAGQTEADCPYRDKRKADGRLTFSRAFRNAWAEGFRSVKQTTQSMEA